MRPGTGRAFRRLRRAVAAAAVGGVMCSLALALAAETRRPRPANPEPATAPAVAAPATRRPAAPREAPAELDEAARGTVQPLRPDVAAADEDWGPLEILGKRVPPGQKWQFVFSTSESFQALSVESPVVVVRGTEPGPTFCLTAGIHGDELNGVEIVRRILDETRATRLRGTIIGVPIVNMLGFERSSRYLPDRRDLNRYFPGNPRGSSASRIAHAFFDAIVRRCAVLVDLHTGSFHRANLPQVRGDLLNEDVRTLAKASGAEVVVYNRGLLGTLRRAATEAGIPTIIYEAGEPMRFQKSVIDRGANVIRVLMDHLGLTAKNQKAGSGSQQIFYQSHWIRAERGGILASKVRLGDWISEGQVIGTIADPMGRDRSTIMSPYDGRVIGMALAPVVIPGVAVYHIGLSGPTDLPVELDEPDRPLGPEPVEIEDDERPE